MSDFGFDSDGGFAADLRRVSTSVRGGFSRIDLHSNIPHGRELDPSVTHYGDIYRTSCLAGRICRDMSKVIFQ